MFSTFNGLRHIMNKNPQIVISKCQVTFNLITVLCMFISIIPSSNNDDNFLPNFKQVVSTLFQVNILVFCWKLVKMPKPAGNKERSIGQANAQVGNKHTSVKGQDEEAAGVGQNTNLIATKHNSI